MGCECQWESEILAHAVRSWPGFTVHIIVRRVVGGGEFDMLSPTHVLSLPLAGARPELSGRIEGEATRFVMDPGQLLLRPAQHRFRGSTRGPGPFRYVMLSVEPEMIALATGGAVEASAEIGPGNDFAHPAVSWSMAALARQVAQPAPAGRLHAETLASAVLFELVRHHSVRDGAFRATLGRTAPELARFVDYVEAHLAEDLSLFALAAEAGLSPAHLNRELKRVTGLAPHQYLLRRRVERARVLLARPGAAIGQVALAVGFSSQAHLNLVFRRVYGVTPGQYRASQR